MDPVDPLGAASEFPGESPFYSRGVAKVKISLPTLHGKQIFFLLPCSVGIDFSIFFSTPLRRKCPPAGGGFAREVSSNAKIERAPCMALTFFVLPMQRGNRFSPFFDPSRVGRLVFEGG